MRLLWLLGHRELNKDSSIYGADIPYLQLFVKHETEDRLRVRITDAEKQRWEVPYNLLPQEPPPPPLLAIAGSRKTSPQVAVAEYSGAEFIFIYPSNPFTSAVKRKPRPPSPSFSFAAIHHFSRASRTPPLDRPPQPPPQTGSSLASTTSQQRAVLHSHSRLINDLPSSPSTSTPPAALSPSRRPRLDIGE